MPIFIRKVREEWGWLGNMAPITVQYGDDLWPTAEALFQALRFTKHEIIQALKREKNPMRAKMYAKSQAEHLKITPRCPQDVSNMRLVLAAKLATHPELRGELTKTGKERIIEDCDKRRNDSGLFWGACNIEGEWVGLNVLGKLWMELRDSP